MQVHYILNELVMGGMVLETNMNEILSRIEDQNKLEKQEVSIFNLLNLISYLREFFKKTISKVTIFHYPTHYPWLGNTV